MRMDRADAGEGVGALLRIAAGEDDRGLCAGESQRGLVAKAAGGAGDDGQLARLVGNVVDGKGHRGLRKRTMVSN